MTTCIVLAVESYTSQRDATLLPTNVFVSRRSFSDCNSGCSIKGLKVSVFVVSETVSFRGKTASGHETAH